jgi:16S rRNA (guanine1207-N2)-methyltransferase
MTPLVRPQERLLTGALPELPAGRLLCNTAGRAQFAAEYATRHLSHSAVCWFLDLYQQRESARAVAVGPANLHLVCSADPPHRGADIPVSQSPNRSGSESSLTVANDFDLVAWAFSKQGDGELTREVLQLGHQRLAIGGRIVVTIDYPRDQWLHELLRGQFRKVTRRPAADGVLYLATKTEPLRKNKDYAAEIAFPDGQRLIHLRTRPGVFSHRELDGGARALIKTMQMQSGMRILDLGCGSGAVGITAAVRSSAVQIQATDSNPRAIEATQWSAERNSVADRVTAVLDCDGSSIAPASFDLVLANPPYYSNFRIAKLFLEIAAKALRPDGELLVVTKSPQWYMTELTGTFREPAALQSGAYAVVRAIRNREPHRVSLTS